MSSPNVAIPSMNTTEFVSSMVEIYSNANPKDVPPVMLWGPPGVGKSDAFKEIARGLNMRTRKKVFLQDVRLLMFNPVDIRGIPVANVQEQIAIWLKPKIFDFNTDNSMINILVLDELTAAPPSVQACAYQITLDRKIGEHKLPDNTIIFCAGNRVTDKSVAYKMPKALCNRMTHIGISNTTESWIDWALANGIDERIVGFISFNPNALNSFNPKNDDIAFATPRTWELASKYLKIFGDIDKCLKLISGTVGMGLGIEFNAFCRIHKNLPTLEEISSGNCNKKFTEIDIQHAIVMRIASSATKLTPEQLNNCIAYATNNLPTELSTMLARMLIKTPKIRPNLVRLPAWKPWQDQCAQLLNVR